MNRLPRAFMILTVVGWLGGPGPAQAQSRHPAFLAGSYSLGGGFNGVGVELQASGRYHASQYGCMGEYGTANGHWSVSGSTIQFKPTEETGEMKGYLRQVRFTRSGGKVRIESEDDDARTLGKDGKSKYSISRRRSAA